MPECANGPASEGTRSPEANASAPDSKVEHIGLDADRWKLALLFVH